MADGLDTADDHLLWLLRSLKADSSIEGQVFLSGVADLQHVALEPSGGKASDRRIDCVERRQKVTDQDELAGSRRAMAHGLLYVGRGNLDYIQYQAEHHRPDAWKGYNISNAAKVDSGPMRQWQHDDENVAYPTFELISKMYRHGKLSKGGNIIAVHKGLARGAPPLAHNGYPSDMPKALRDWPNLNFLTYHSCIQDTFFDDQALAEIRASEAGTRPLMGGVPNIDWTTPYAIWTGPFRNSYAEIGTTFASSVVTFPTVTAHILGQLLMFKGPNQIVFGSDSLWYGSPQWQIEALWRFKIPEKIRERWGYPELDEQAKRNILGLTSAKLYGLEPRLGSAYKPIPAHFERRISDSLKRTLEMPPYDNTLNLQGQDDNLSKWRERYLAIGVEPSRSRYGWIRSSL